MNLEEIDFNFHSKDSNILIDVRSTKEFKESTIPGAVNIPLLTNQERDIIGEIYHKEGEKNARLKGVELVSPKLPNLINQLSILEKSYENLIVFCARGGLRSEAIVTFARLAGIEATKYPGGYKKYRHLVLSKLNNFNLSANLVVLHGHTGVGKTEVLKELSKRGWAILNLEKLANHRGSAFGSIGLGKPHNQKYFDSLLLNKLEKYNNKKYIFIESESKRIGYSVLPSFLMNAMDKGIHILIKSDLEARIERIYQEYSQEYINNTDEFKERTKESLRGIKKYIIKEAGKSSYNNLVKLVEAGKFKEVIKILLVDYYDKFYQYAEKHQPGFSLKIQGDNISKLTNKIEDYITSTKFEKQNSST